jgi:hypothetical protein
MRTMGPRLQTNCTTTSQLKPFLDLLSEPENSARVRRLSRVAQDSAWLRAARFCGYVHMNQNVPSFTVEKPRMDEEDSTGFRSIESRYDLTNT